MSFEELTKQRKYILVTSGIGIISLFLPFISFGGIVSVSAINYGGLAYLVLLGFILSGIVCLAENQAYPLDNLPLLLVVTGGATAAGILIYHFFQYLDMLDYIGIGFYLAIVCSLVIIYFSLIFKAINTEIETIENDDDSQIKINPSDD